METPHNPIFLMPFIFGVCGLVSLVLTYRKADWPKPNRMVAIVFAVPSALYLVMFYALAIHLFQSLEGWPTSIGDRGFPDGLILHANLTMWAFYILLMLTVFIWPVIFFLSILLKLRFVLPYLGIHAVSFAFAFGAMLLAPEPFLYWWWD